MMSKTQKIALDIGSGDVKYFYIDKNGEEKFGKLPAAVAEADEAQTGFLSDAPTESVRYEGSYYYVGGHDQAIMNNISSRSVDFQKRYNGLLAYSAIKEAGFDLDQPIEIVTGITLRYWDDRDDVLKGMNNIIVNGKQLQTKVKRVFAQGQGAFINEGSPSGHIAVIDGGYNTLDFLYFVDGKPQRNKCYANNKGASTIVQNIKNFIENKYQITISEQQARHFFDKKKIVILGEEQDLGDTIRRLQKDYIDRLFMELKAKDGDLLKLADQVIFTGGLAYYLEGFSLAGNTKLSKKPYEYTNVKGYYYGK